jgi:hypothetical protein
MGSHQRDILGKHVRLLPDAYIRLFLPMRNWTGTIESVREFKHGALAVYTFRLDKKFHAPHEGTEFYVREEEVELC